MAGRRIPGYDVARGLAVIGMVLVNFHVVTGADRAEPSLAGALTKSLEGRAAATFVVLAGVGLALMTRRAREEGDATALRRARRTILKRALLLFVVGLLYTPLWPADILHFYGVYLALAAFFLAARERWLWAAAGGLVAAFVPLVLLFDYEAGWNWETLHYEGLWGWPGAVRHLFFNGFHPAVPWAAFVFVGMALGRRAMEEPRVRRKVLAWGASAWALAELASHVLVEATREPGDATGEEGLAVLFGTAPMPPMPLYLLAGTGCAVAVIALAIEVTERFAGASWWRPLEATGQLALTLYVAHVVLGMGVLEALGRIGGQTPVFALTASAVFCLLAIIVATLWRRFLGRGPLERLVRRLAG